jgi:seryl-tRNA synthetase
MTVKAVAASGFTAGARATGGLATLEADAMVLRDALERRYLGWAREVGAASTLYPPLMKVTDLNRIDYFHNFPHLAMLCAGLAEEAAPHYAQSGAGTGEVSSIHLADAQSALPSAACYNIYLDMADTYLDEPRLVTTVATCFRREQHFDGLKRLLGFSMREIVCVGQREAVLAHLNGFKQRLTAYFAEIELPIETKPASDPFFDSSSGRALMGQLFPVKEEFVFDGELAIASVNFHRNFFGERCGIRTASGEPAFSGCVAFGIERWIQALTTHFKAPPIELAERV